MPNLQIKLYYKYVYIEKSIYRIWHYLQFQGSTGGLETCLLWIREILPYSYFFYIFMYK